VHSMQKPQQGLSIVELMVAMVIGLLILSGVLNIFLSSSETYRATENLSRVQENGRFAIDFLATDTRQAGNKGNCSRDTEVRNHLNESGNGYNATLYEIAGGIFGWESTDGGFNLPGYRQNTDIVLLKHAAQHSGITASGNTPENANTINLNGASGIPAGQIIMVSDGIACDVFQKRNNANANSLTRGASSGNPGPGNKNPSSSPFSKAYTVGMEINVVRSTIYYIANTNSGPMLRRMNYDQNSAGVPEDLVDGIVDMQLCYGIDSDSDNNVDTFVAANTIADWNTVAAVRVSFVSLSQDGNFRQGSGTAAPSVQFSDCDGTLLTRTQANYPEMGPDRVARVFSSTIAMRNRLP